MKQPLIVYHFGSKEDLWQAAVEEVWRRMESTLRQHAAGRGLAIAAEAPLAVEASAQHQASFDPRSEALLDAHVDAVLALLAPEHRDAAGPTGARPA